MLYIQFGEQGLVIFKEFVSLQFAELNVVIFNTLISVLRTDPSTVHSKFTTNSNLIFLHFIYSYNYVTKC